MEKIKFGSTQYDLVPGGATFGMETARVVAVWPEGKTYEQVEMAITGIERIEILDSAGDVLTVHKNYLHLEELSRKKDYVIRTERIDDGINTDTGEILYSTKDIVGTVLIATLKRTDMRLEVDTLKETVDMLVLSNLEG